LSLCIFVTFSLALCLFSLLLFLLLLVVFHAIFFQWLYNIGESYGMVAFEPDFMNQVCLYACVLRAGNKEPSMFPPMSFYA
jgi:hypothetical protein